jgi:hypothetical protein
MIEKADLRRQAEAAALENLTLSPESLASLSPEAIRGMLSDMRLHQVELEVQSVELRRAQMDLNASNSRYFD